MIHIKLLRSPSELSKRGIEYRISSSAIATTDELAFHPAAYVYSSLCQTNTSHPPGSITMRNEPARPETVAGGSATRYEREPKSDLPTEKGCIATLYLHSLYIYIYI